MRNGFILMAILVTLVMIGIGSVNATVTNIDTGENFTQIQEAIEDSNTIDGHTIAIGSGVYVENLLVNKSLTIKSINGCDVIIESRLHKRPVIRIPASNVTISGLCIRGSMDIPYKWRMGSLFITSNGIWIYNSTHDCCITNCTILKTKNAIGINGANHNEITNNIIESTYEEGIELYGASNNVIKGNNITKCNLDGIVLHQKSNNNTILNNTIYGDSKKGIMNNSICGGTQNGIHLSHTRDSVVQNNSVCNNRGDGIYLYYAKNSIVQNNHVFNNLKTGILLSSTRNAIVTGNNASYNKKHGIRFHNSMGNITHNIMIANLECCINETGSTDAIREDNICKGNRCD